MVSSPDVYTILYLYQKVNRYTKSILVGYKHIYISYIYKLYISIYVTGDASYRTYHVEARIWIALSAIASCSPSPQAPAGIVCMWNDNVVPSSYIRSKRILCRHLSKTLSVPPLASVDPQQYQTLQLQHCLMHRRCTDTSGHCVRTFLWSFCQLLGLRCLT